jgi:diadenosine tetraphosphate (Ap4A) HIT family hydrolase
MIAMSDHCPFGVVTSRVLAQNEHAFCVADRYPVSQGHCLVIPREHIASLFDLTDTHYGSCFELLREVKQRIDNMYRPSGFNVGINCGLAAGQTVEHAHIHLIPRYEGDVANPRGGVRNVIPGKGDY